MIAPTTKNLELLLPYDTADAALSALGARGRPPTIRPKLRLDSDGRIEVVLPDDAGFEGLPELDGRPRRSDPGCRSRCRRKAGPRRLTRHELEAGSAIGAGPRAASTASSRRAEQPAMSTGGTVSVTMVRAMARKASAAGPVPVEGHRHAGVAARGHRGLDRHLAQQLDADLVGQGLPAALAEQGVAGAVLAGEGAHVLDDAGHPQERAPGHVGGADGHLLGARPQGW